MHARLTWIVMFALALAVVGAGTEAQKKRVTGGPSDAVFGDGSLDRIRSDGFLTRECSTGAIGAELSRYCGGTFTDSETGLTYDGVGPECSRISYGSGGQYLFRTLSSKCPTYPPPGGGRKLTLNFSQHLTGVCGSAGSADVLIPVTINAGTESENTRYLNACGSNLIDDVQIIADGMFTGTSAVVTVYFSLHAPPLSNVMQFVMEFTQPLPVADNGTTRTLSATFQSAVLWRMTVGKGGKVQKAATPIGEYQLPFSLTARTAPMPVFESGGQ